MRNMDEPCEPCTEKAEVEAIKENLRFSLEEYLEWSLLKNRTMIFHGSVGRVEMEKACKRLTYLGQVSKEPIQLILNSVGGEVYAGLLVFDTIRELVKNGVDVTCEARGLAASMGTVLLQAGSRRLSSPHTRFLIHEVSSWAWGKASELEEEAVETKKVNALIAKIIADRSGKSIEEVQQVIKKKEYWLSAEEALKFGLVDEIKE